MADDPAYAQPRQALAELLNQGWRAALPPCATAGGSDATPKPKPDLVFVGTVESIQASPLPQSLANWIVTFRVDRVESGTFTAKTFSFRIHSPSIAGLETQGQYVVEAMRTDAGYAVDQYQWMNKTHNRPARRDNGRHR